MAGPASRASVAATRSPYRARLPVTDVPDLRQWLVLACAVSSLWGRHIEGRRDGPLTRLSAGLSSTREPQAVASSESVAGGHDPSGFDHENRRAPWRPSAVRDAFGHGVALLLSKDDSLPIFEIDPQLAFEDQEELTRQTTRNQRYPSSQSTLPGRESRPQPTSCRKDRGVRGAEGLHPCATRPGVGARTGRRHRPDPRNQAATPPRGKHRRARRRAHCRRPFADQSRTADGRRRSLRRNRHDDREPLTGSDVQQRRELARSTHRPPRRHRAAHRHGRGHLL